MPGGGDVRVLDVPDQDLWLIASSVPGREYGEAALESGLRNIVARRAMAHEAVVEHFLSAPAVLPMQLFALFTSDARAVEHVTGDRRRLAAILKRIDRRHEWGLRLTWDEAAVRTSVERKHKPAASGADYLARKRDLLDVNRVQLKEARTAAERLFRTMAREASDARRRTETEQAAPGSRLLLDAAFLVPSAQGAAFRAALRRNTKALEASGLQVSLTGPWPPYNFIGWPRLRRQTPSWSSGPRTRRCWIWSTTSSTTASC
jgi:hypothetical protein